MAINNIGSRIIMDAYDFGVQLPFIFSDFEFEEGDQILFELKKNKDSLPIISKLYDNDYDTYDIFVLSIDFTEKESKDIFPGNYVYYMKLVRNKEVKDTLLSDDFVIKK